MVLRSCPPLLAFRQRSLLDGRAVWLRFSLCWLGWQLGWAGFDLSLASGLHAIFLRSLVQGDSPPLSGFQLVFRWLFVSVSYEDLIPYLSLCIYFVLCWFPACIASLSCSFLI